MFSSRIDLTASENRLTRLLSEKRRAGVEIIDLAETNPTRVGLEYPADWARALAGPASADHDPTPRGLRTARGALAEYLTEQGAPTDPDHIVLCASTSEAYSLLLKLFCDPGDVVLAPRPSYPLLDPIAGLEGVRLERYPLDPDRGWRIDPRLIPTGIDARAKAIVVVNPNNPTGTYVKDDDLGAIEELAASRAIPIISDEVFFEYGHAPDPRRVRVAQRSTAAAALGLGGLSKLVGLPQVKLAWIVIGGPAALRARILDGLEHVNDTYLSCSGPAQRALPELLRLRETVGAGIAARVNENRAWLAGSGVEVLDGEGGWTAVIRLAEGSDDEGFVLDLLERHDVLVHPGYFYDFSGGAYVVVSLLVRPPVLREGIARMLTAARGN